MLRTTLFLAISFVIACPPNGALAQCPLAWTSGGPQPGLSGNGRCSTVWDPDGAGPAPQRLVVGGEQLNGGTQPPGQRVMTWDGSGWQTLADGPGSFGSVLALTVWNGQLVAGGTFSDASGSIRRIALWTGSSWQQIGGGLPVTVDVLTVWSDNLIAAGRGDFGLPDIRVWNGVDWTPLPTPPQLRAVYAMVSYQGLLCVGGSTSSTQAGDGALERWNGTSWLLPILATGQTPRSALITSLKVRQLSLVISSLYVGGGFTTIGGVAASNIASTSGGTTFAFSPVGDGLPRGCFELHVRASGFGTAIVARVSGASPGAGCRCAAGRRRRARRARAAPPGSARHLSRDVRARRTAARPRRAAAGSGRCRSARRRLGV